MFKKKSYNSKIKVYYRNNLSNNLNELAQKAIASIFEQEQKTAKNFILVKAKTNSKKGEVFKYQGANKNYYLKHYQHRSFTKVAKNLVRKVEAVRYFEKAEKIKQAGISVIKPVLAIKRQQNIFIKDSIFVTEEAKGEVLQNYLANNQVSDKLKRKIIRAMAKLWAKLINNGFIHQDPNLDNFLIKLKKDQVKLGLIDIDNIYSYPFLPKIVVIDALARLYGRSLRRFAKIKANFPKPKNRELFFSEFNQAWHKKFELEQLIETVNTKTAKRLVKKDRSYLIKNDDILADYLSC